jgi:probable phosphomutase (TIGR03848 family)
MLLLLVRHALTSVTGKRLTGWLPGFHLSAEGERQAEALAERIAPLPVAAVYSSPLERCRETAELIAERHGLRVTALKDLGEVDYGDWQGKSLKALYRTKGWAELRARRSDFRFPNGETIREAQTRGVRAVEALRGRHADELVVAASHADLIRLIVAGYIGLGLDLYNRISVDASSVTALQLNSDVPRLLRLSDTASLTDLLPRLEAALPKRRARIASVKKRR